MGKLLRTAVAVPLALAVLITAAAPAHAYREFWSWQRGQYDFFASGQIRTEVGDNGAYEQLKVWDDYGDGHSAVLKWHDQFGHAGRVWDANGSDNDTPGVRQINVREGTNVYLRLCIGEYSSKRILRCDESGWWIEFA